MNCLSSSLSWGSIRKKCRYGDRTGKNRHFLDSENQEVFDKLKQEGLSNIQISHEIANRLDVTILKRSAKTWDGGYTISGIFGHGDAFVMRDPAGIRPAFYYIDDEIVVVTSERPAVKRL